MIMYPESHKAFSLAQLKRQYTNPHELYARLRSHDCIYFDGSSQSWLVTGYKPAISMLGDPRFSSKLGEHTSLSTTSIGRQMLFLDGEVHERTRKILLKPLAEIARKMTKDVREFAHSVIVAKQKEGVMDLVKDYAATISLLTVAHVLGIPTQNKEELQQVEAWSDTFADITSGYFRGDKEDIIRLEKYFRGLIEAKRRAPSDDLLSAIIAAADVFPTEDDLVANCIMIFTAGRVTTKKLIGNGVPLLFHHWQQFQKEYRENPRFLKPLGEELLRFTTPTRYLVRQATEDIDLSAEFPGYHRVHRGEKVLLFLEAANHDQAIFLQPEQFHPLRRPNSHIAFGYGRHQCPGATMARIEMRIALDVLFSLPELHLKPETAHLWNTNPNLGGYTSCPVLFHI
jgi:cytochrome P450